MFSVSCCGLCCCLLPECAAQECPPLIFFVFLRRVSRSVLRCVSRSVLRRKGGAATPSINLREISAGGLATVRPMRNWAGRAALGLKSAAASLLVNDVDDWARRFKVGALKDSLSVSGYWKGQRGREGLQRGQSAAVRSPNHFGGATSAIWRGAPYVRNRG